MIKLSFSTGNALLNAPHTWVCKQMGLPTFTTTYFEEGKKAHRLIQDHVVGLNKMTILNDLPSFSMVETRDFDDTMRVEKKINSKYSFHGFVDGKDPDTGRFLEIKSGKRWSLGDFFKTDQWRLYAWALPETYREVYLVNVPRQVDQWSANTIKVYNTTVTPPDLKKAEDFLQRVINTIENINIRIDAEMANRTPGRSRWCYYQGCPFCEAHETMAGQ